MQHQHLVLSSNYSFSSFLSFSPKNLSHIATHACSPLRFLSNNNNDNNMVLVSSLRPPQDLPSLCTIVVSTLWVQYHPSSTKAVQQQLWDDARRLEFHTYCQSILSYLNISPSVIYTRYIYIDNIMKKEHRREGSITKSSQFKIRSELPFVITDKHSNHAGVRLRKGHLCHCTAPCI